MSFNFQKGELILIDKELEWTSFDVVNKLRSSIKRKLNIKKLKVGHAGTLDPLATGLIILCTGKLTKSINKLNKAQAIIRNCLTQVIYSRLINTRDTYRIN